MTDHDQKGPTVRVNRPMYRLGNFRDEYLKPKEEPKPVLVRIREKLGKAVTCNKAKLKKTCVNTLPCIRIMRKYQWRTDFINDVISGLTVGIMQLPQGMAYALLADLPPVVGLYMSFFPVVVYFFFGTSKQLSIGTVAIVSLMTGAIVARESGAWRTAQEAGIGTGTTLRHENETTTMSTTLTTLTTTLFHTGASVSGSVAHSTTAKVASASISAAKAALDAEEIAYKIKIASSVAFVAGLAQIGMGICRVGFVTTYMSDSLVSGFTTGAAVHVFTSQVKYALGLKIPRYESTFQIILTYVAIIPKLPKTNIAELVITTICIVILYVTKNIIGEKLKKKCRIPIPIELIVVIVGTLVSYYGDFRAKWGIRTVGKIPAGLPEPAFPPLTNVNNYGIESVVIGIVAFAQSVSLAVLLAKKYHYNIDSNKEMIAYGTSTFFGSFFKCYPVAGSVSRSSVQDSAGGRTQLTSIFSASLVLIVILFIGPLFEELPNCCLSAIIMVALKSMFLQVLELRTMIKVSPYDCAIWIVTFLSVVILNIDIGLYIGIIFAFFTVVTRGQIASVKTVENLVDNDIYKSVDLYTKTDSRDGIRVVTYCSPLYYANGELFQKHIYKKTGVTPERLRKVLKRLQEKKTQSMRNVKDLVIDSSTVVELEMVDAAANGELGKEMNGACANGNAEKAPDPRPFRHLVIDCTGMSFVDPMGIKMLKLIIDEYNGVGITVYLGGIRDEVWHTMQAADFTVKYSPNIYLTLYDAVLAAESSQQSEGKQTSTGTTLDLLSKNENMDPEATAEDQLLTTEERA